MTGARKTIRIATEARGQIKNGIRLFSEGAHERALRTRARESIRWKGGSDSRTIHFAWRPQIQPPVALDQPEDRLRRAGVGLNAEPRKQFREATGGVRDDARSPGSREAFRFAKRTRRGDRFHRRCRGRCRRRGRCRCRCRCRRSGCARGFGCRVLAHVVECLFASHPGGCTSHKGSYGVSGKHAVRRELELPD